MYGQWCEFSYTIDKTTKSDAKSKCDTYVQGTTVCELD